MKFWHPLHTHSSKTQACTDTHLPSAVTGNAGTAHPRDSAVAAASWAAGGRGRGLLGAAGGAGVGAVGSVVLAGTQREPPQRSGVGAEEEGSVRRLCAEPGQ